MKVGVTRQQSVLLKFVKTFCDENGYSPSYQEIADHMGLASKSNVHRLVRGLAERGHVTFEANRSRTMTVVA